MEAHILYTVVKHWLLKWKSLWVFVFFLIPVMPYNSAHHCVVEVENFLFVLGGEDQWNPNGNYWTTLIVDACIRQLHVTTMKYPRQTVLKRKIYMAHGFGGPKAWRLHGSVMVRAPDAGASWWKKYECTLTVTSPVGEDREKVGRVPQSLLSPWLQWTEHLPQSLQLMNVPPPSYGTILRTKASS